MTCRLCDENKNPEALWVAQGKHWNVHVCWFQHTLGTLGIILNHHIENFTELTQDEIAELGKLLQESQAKVSSELQPDWFNIQMNGNWHHHLHFLLLPRYKEQKEFNGKHYEDQTFGQPVTHKEQEESKGSRKLLTDLLQIQFSR